MKLPGREFQKQAAVPISKATFNSLLVVASMQRCSLSGDVHRRYEKGCYSGIAVKGTAQAEVVPDCQWAE